MTRSDEWLSRRSRGRPTTKIETRLGARWNDETRAIIREHLDEAAFAEASAQGRTLTVDKAVAFALHFPD